jgi:hypothetical protein
MAERKSKKRQKDVYVEPTPAEKLEQERQLEEHKLQVWHANNKWREDNERNAVFMQQGNKALAIIMTAFGGNAGVSRIILTYLCGVIRNERFVSDMDIYATIREGRSFDCRYQYMGTTEFEPKPSVPRRLHWHRHENTEYGSDSEELSVHEEEKEGSLFDETSGVPIEPTYNVRLRIRHESDCTELIKYSHENRLVLPRGDLAGALQEGLDGLSFGWEAFKSVPGGGSMSQEYMFHAADLTNCLVGRQSMFEPKRKPKKAAQDVVEDAAKDPAEDLAEDADDEAETADD